MTKATTIQTGNGKGRNPWAIREYLSSIYIEGKPGNMSAVARLAKTYPQHVQDTVRGIRNYKKVLKTLEELGCPKEYLYGTTNINKSNKAA